ncbi:MAG TPA: hypothetical protein VGM24_01260 [Puia sp.]|jgi:hypothetical protein
MRTGGRIPAHLFFLLLSSTGFAQQPFSGRVFKKGSTEVLAGINVTNLTGQKHNVSDLGGNYRIPAAPGDSIIFSSAGYLPDTIVLNPACFADPYPVFLTAHIVALPPVTVGEESGYQVDSLQRRKDYGFIYDKKHPVKLWNEKRPGDEPGFSFSPAGFFSKTEKEKRRLKKRLQQEEEDDYIDLRFPRNRVAQLTRLTGDSLQQFMIRYRPSYRFCRNASNQDMFFYINDKLILFKKG